MNTLADAAFLSSGDEPAFNTSAYPNDEFNSMRRPNGRMLMQPRAAAMPARQAQQVQPQQLGSLNPHESQADQMRRMLLLVPPQQQMVVDPPPSLPGSGRYLQILDHTVHRIDVHTMPNGTEEREMVVSNLRHFTFKIGVFDPRIGQCTDCDLPLKAELLYENGQPVEQLATCEPLLVGNTEVVSMQGTALFKLRITSLSSHRDKQRFRIRVSPLDPALHHREPGLTVVTTPMKCVTKLSHRSASGSGAAKGDEGEGEGGEEGGGEESEGGGASAGSKRKRDTADVAHDIDTLIEHEAQLQTLQQTNLRILDELVTLKRMLINGGLAKLRGCADAADAGCDDDPPKPPTIKPVDESAAEPGSTDL